MQIPSRVFIEEKGLRAMNDEDYLQDIAILFNSQHDFSGNRNFSEEMEWVEKKLKNNREKVINDTIEIVKMYNYIHVDYCNRKLDCIMKYVRQIIRSERYK